MGKATVTEAEIIAAGERLEARNEPVSGWSLRRECGTVGKPGRLKEVWLAHKSASDRQPPPRVSVLPPALEERRQSIAKEVVGLIDGFLVGAWSQADQLANERTTQERATAAAAIEAHVKEMDLATLEVEAAEERVEQLLSEVQRLEAERDAQRLELARGGERLVTAEASARNAEQTARELRQQIQVAESASAAAARRTDAAEAETRATMKLFERTQRDLERSQRDSEALRAQLAQEIEQRGKLERHLGVLEERLHTETTRVTSLSGDVERERGEVEKLRDMLSRRFGSQKARRDDAGVPYVRAPR